MNEFSTLLDKLNEVLRRAQERFKARFIVRASVPMKIPGERSLSYEKRRGEYGLYVGEAALLNASIEERVIASNHLMDLWSVCLHEEAEAARNVLAAIEAASKIEQAE